MVFILRVKAVGKISSDERPQHGYAATSKSLFEKKAQEASETRTARNKLIEQEKDLFGGTSNRRNTFEKAAIQEERTAAPKIKLEDEEIDLSGRTKSHKQLFEEQAKLSAQVSPSLPRKIFGEQEGEVDISGKAKSKKELFEKIATESQGTSPGVERKILQDVDLSGRAKAHRNIFQQKIEEESQVRTSRKMHLEEDVFSGKASSRRAIFEKFGAGDDGRQKGGFTPAEEEKADLSGRAKSHKQKFEQFAEEASKVKTAQSKSDELEHLSGRAMSHKEYFDEKVADAAKTKTSEMRLLSEEEEAVAGRARSHKLSFEEKAAKDLEVKTSDKSRLQEAVPDKGSLSFVVSSFESKQNEQFVKERGDDIEVAALGVAKSTRSKFESGDKEDGHKRKKSRKEKHGDEHAKKKKRKKSSLKLKDHKERKTPGEEEEKHEAEEKVAAKEKEESEKEEEVEDTQEKEDEESATMENKDDHKIDGEKHESESEEEEQETRNELNAESEIMVAASEDVQCSVPESGVLPPEEDARSSKVEEKPKAAASEVQSSAGGEDVPMDYRARRAARLKQREAEKAGKSEGWYNFYAVVELFYNFSNSISVLY